MRGLRVLLDESVPSQLRGFLGHHETLTAVYAGFGAFKNGALLKAAEDAGFDVMVTADKTLRFEQNLAGRELALVCLSANSWTGPNVASIVAAVDAAKPGSLTQVNCGRFVRLSRIRKPRGAEPN